MKGVYIIPTILFGICLFVVGTTSQAFAFGEQPSSITLSPQYPEPLSQVTASLAGSLFTTLGDEVSWFVDGAEQSSAKNTRSISFTAKNTGETTVVLARITSKDGSVTEVRRTVVPLRIDIIISADTYIPHFYKGRALPSSAGVITARAFVFTDTQESVSKYSYVWRVNGSVTNNDVTKGGNSVKFSPNFETKLPVSVTILNAKGVAVGAKEVIVPIHNPEIYFYAANPLRGITQTALVDNYYFLGDEITLRAEPYFIEKNYEAMATTWEIDNKDVTSDNNPYELTLKKETEEGSATVLFELFNTSEFLQSAKESLILNF